jgi:hypothetical protein
MDHVVSDILTDRGAGKPEVCNMEVVDYHVK